MQVILSADEYNELKSKAMNCDFSDELIKKIESFDVDYQDSRKSTSFIDELKHNIRTHKENLVRERV